MRKIKSVSKYIGFLVGLVFLLFSAFTFAQANSSSYSNVRNFKTYTTLQQKLEAAQERASTTIQNLEKIQQQAQNKIQQVQTKVQEKITEIRDQQKQRLAQQIVNQFDHINQVWTNHFTQLLNQYDVILQKIQNRADKAAANNSDVSTVNSAIQAAQTAIVNARTAVETQAQKTYTVNLTAINNQITTTSTAAGQNELIKNLKSQFQSIKDQLHKDLFALRDGAMKDARTALQNAFQALSKIPGVDKEPKTTSTSTSRE